MKKSTQKIIDDEQTDTIEEHFKLIVTDDTLICSDYTKMTPNDLPEWFNEELFKQGQNYFKRNVLGVTSGYLVGLVAVFLIPSIAKILMSTNQSSTPCTAFRRYFQTILHIYNMQVHDVKNPKSKFYKSLNTIRWKHAMSSRRSLERKHGGISQKDMVLTQFSFIGYVLMCPEMLALTNETKERQGLNHFWRVVGHLLGIPDRLNVCRRNEYETTLLCKKIKEEVYLKQLKVPNSDFFHLTYVAIDGLKCLDPLLDLDAFLVFFYKAHDSKYEKELSLYSTLILIYRTTVLYLIGIPVIGYIVRTYWNIYLQSLYLLFEKYPVLSWIKYGKENSHIKLYPHSTF